MTLLLCLSFTAHAEFRAYQYVVKNKIQNSPDQKNATIVVSSLNPVSYIAYNGGANLIEIDLLRTWVCPGNTSSFKGICPSPYKKLVQETEL